MAISINWPTRVIYVPKNDLVLVSGSLYELDVNTFRLALKDLEDSEDGQPWPSTHNHNTSVLLSGVTYARSVEIINGYTVEFENGQYTVRCIGANHNLADVKVANSVSLIVGNSAGMVVSAGTSPSDIWNLLAASHNLPGSMGEKLNLAAQSGGGGISGPSNVSLLFVDAGADPVPLVLFSVTGQGTARTSTDGVAEFGLSDGTYQIVSSPTGGVIFPTTEIVVDGDGSFTITGSSMVLPDAPADPELCTVFGYQYLNGVPTEGTRVQIRHEHPVEEDEGLIFEVGPQVADSDADGFWSMELIRGHSYLVTILRSGINNFRIVIPDAGVYNLADLL
jgi:hypothetical protein